MSKAIQYSTDGGATWQQFGIKTADITSGGLICNTFYSIKDSKDNIFIICYTERVGGAGNAKIIRIDKNGNKAVATQTGCVGWKPYSSTPVLITRDEAYLWITDGNNGYTSVVPTNFTNGAVLPQVTFSLNWYSSSATIYQDRYIWVASGTTVKIYDYTTKAELASVSIATTAIPLITCSVSNELYFGYGTSAGNVQYGKAIFNGVSTITWSQIIGNTISNCKQLLIDKWGDLIILTNSGTASTLLKYTSAGVQVGTTPLTLQAPMYNLNVDKNGAIFYSNDLGTYKINKNSAGQQPLVLGTKIRDTGMTTYGNRMFLDPAVFN